MTDTSDDLVGDSEIENLLPGTDHNNGYPTSALHETLFDCYTYASLCDESKAEVLRLVNFQDKSLFDDNAVRSIFEKRASRKEARITLDDLLRTYPEEKIQFLNASQALSLDNELQFAMVQYLAQLEAAKRNFADIRSPESEKHKCYKKLLKCERLRKLIILRKLFLEISKLDKNSEKYNSKNGDYRSLSSQLDTESIFVSLKPNPIPNRFSFLPFSVKDPDDVEDSDYVIFELTLANGRRLCWVWNRCLIESVIPAAHEQLIVSTTIAAYISWILYWFRGGVVTFGGLQHSFDMFVSEEESVIEASKRRQAHWDERGDEILNDVVWGMANFACCFWLIGASLGIIGDSITFVLLFMDLRLAYLRFEKAKEDYLKSTENYNKQIDKLVKSFMTDNIKDNEIIHYIRNLTSIQNQKEKRKEISEILEKMRVRLQNLIIQKHYDDDETQSIEELDICVAACINQNKAQEAHEESFNQKYQELFTDVCYSALLLLAFGMMVFASPVVSLVGASMLGASTIVYRHARAEIEFASIRKAIDVLDQNHHNLVVRFIDLGGKEENQIYNTDLIKDQMRQVYLDILQQGAESGYQHELLKFKYIEYARSLFLRIVVPLAIGLTLAFAPATVLAVPTYVFLMLGVLVFAVVSSAWINASYSPTSSKWSSDGQIMSESPVFNTNDYFLFKKLAKENNCQNPSNEILDSVDNIDSTDLISKKPQNIKSQQILAKTQACRFGAPIDWNKSDRGDQNNDSEDKHKLD